MEVFSDKTIRSILEGNYSRATVFENFNLDYNHFLDMTLQSLCEQKGISLDILTHALRAVRNEPLELDFSSLEIPLLIAYLKNTHHEYARNKIPHIKRNIERLRDLDGGVPGLDGVFERFAVDLRKHMLLEEKVIFPFIRQVYELNQQFDLEKGRVLLSDHSVDLLCASHTSDHDEMAEVKMICGGFTYRPSDPITYKILMTDLSLLEKDIHLHARIEDEILFHQARQSEAILQERIRLGGSGAN